MPRPLPYRGAKQLSRSRRAMLMPPFGPPGGESTPAPPETFFLLLPGSTDKVLLPGTTDRVLLAA